MNFQLDRGRNKNRWLPCSGGRGSSLTLSDSQVFGCPWRSIWRHRDQDDRNYVHVVNIPLDGDSTFYNYPHRSDPLLQHEPRRKLPAGVKIKQFPLRISTIDGSSVSGTIAVINDVYINQLKTTHEELSDMAIPSINDQSTNARIRGAKALQTEDVNPFTRLQFIQLGFGLFHLSMNLVWALLHAHRGSISEPGSLTYFFAVLDRTSLGCEHPTITRYLLHSCKFSVG